MANFKLIPDPTFTAPVSLARPGQSNADVVFTFRHLDDEARFDLDEKSDAHAAALRREFGVPDNLDAAIANGSFDLPAHKKYLRALRAHRPARLMQVVCGWSLDEEFTEANVRLLLSNYPASFDAIMAVYRAEVEGARAKN